MPSQFSTIGFSITSGEDLAALASQVADKADRISTPPGEYLKWAPPSGEQLWLQISPEGDAMGMSAHFAGKSSVRVAVEARVARPSHTPLDGTFLAWANPPAGAAAGGDYPFAFDCPDAATHLDLALPATSRRRWRPSRSRCRSTTRPRPSRRRRPREGPAHRRGRSFRRAWSRRLASRSARPSRMRSSPATCSRRTPG